MPTCQKSARPLVGCLRNAQISPQSARPIRTFSSTSRWNNEVAAETTTSSAPVFDPATVTSKKGEKALMRSGVLPIGSRRRRAALQTSDNIPFELLPYQCFQEARKVLQKDREEKLEAIKRERLRINNLMAQDPSAIKGDETQKQVRLTSMRKHLEHLKILADINDPLIKKRFEDGLGDMNKPIYRYLADKKWRKYDRLVIEQRINQLGVVPDVLPHFDPTADVRLAFRTRNVQPGEFVDSRLSEIPARLRVQVFDKGERLVTVVMIDSDVPDVEKDGFSTRCHYLATNIPLSPAGDSLPLTKVDSDQVVLPWLPPFAQKGSPYHRYSIFILEQKPGHVLDKAELAKKVERDGYNMRSFVDKFNVKPIGVTIFRSLWDEGTAAVMQRAGIEGADIVFKRKRIEALKPKKKARGWEAKRSSGKYASLGKYVSYRK